MEELEGIDVKGIIKDGIQTSMKGFELLEKLNIDETLLAPTTLGKKEIRISPNFPFYVNWDFILWVEFLVFELKWKYVDSYFCRQIELQRRSNAFYLNIFRRRLNDIYPLKKCPCLLCCTVTFSFLNECQNKQA